MYVNRRKNLNFVSLSFNIRTCSRLTVEFLKKDFPLPPKKLRFSQQWRKWVMCTTVQIYLITSESDGGGERNHFAMNNQEVGNRAGLGLPESPGLSAPLLCLAPCRILWSTGSMGWRFCFVWFIAFWVPSTELALYHLLNGREDEFVCRQPECTLLTFMTKKKSIIFLSV